MKINFRLLCVGGFLFTVASMLFALYLQHYKGFEPCPMCIFQRIAMMTSGFFFLLGAIHGPRAGGRWIYAGLADLAAIVGALIAARHVWLQSLPEDLRPACGPTLDYLLDMMPMKDAVEFVLRGEGQCAKIDAQWLGLSLPFWTMIGFIVLSFYAALTPVVAKLFERRVA
ncbi:MAG TPA: disulfide bond formation protein B [Nevskiaceae bacterium]|nr:disulfide bond formation protein B [Nevskiaceae bacterium]